ncbi:MAG TPA: hypothetical protein VE912_12965 [Bacteroidales bacterium]|nr:hypothetical protein [Bacteroidales bacterium]
MDEVCIINMKKLLNKYSFLSRVLTVTAFFLLHVQYTFAQLPRNYPNPESQPLDLTLKNILLYFVSPVLLVVIFFLVRRYKRKQDEKSRNEKENH